MSYPPPPPPTPSTPATQVRPIPDGLGLATLMLGGLFTAYLVVSFLLSFEAASVYGDAARGGIDAMSTRVVAYDLVQIAAVIAIPLYIVGCLFLQRAHDIAVARGAPQARSKVWVWLGWWVPIVSFWFPYQVVRDLANAARPKHGAGVPLGLWWACWLTILIGNRIAANAIPFDGVANESYVRALPFIEGVIAAGGVLGFILWVRIVRSIETGMSPRA